MLPCAPGETCDEVGDVCEPLCAVFIDIKFCGDPNAFNCKKRGVLPVTIFGTDTFDVDDIDLSTLKLCLEDLSACTGAPVDWSVADRGNPETDLGAAECAFEDPDGDGTFEEQDHLNPDRFLDLDVAFDVGEVQTLLGDFCALGAKGDVSEALVISGLTFDGVPIFSVPLNDNTGIDRLVKANR